MHFGYILYTAQNYLGHLGAALYILLKINSVTEYILLRVWSGGTMVLGKLPVPGSPTILVTVGQGHIALAVGAGGLDIFTLIYPFSTFSLSFGDGSI